jgi:ssDNA-binding Zn-finger/Zn-ribbon topoisomerase 1
MCNKCWKDLHDFLHDNTLTFTGYQAYPKHPEKGNFLFTHEKENCGTTLSLKIQKFKELLGQDIELLPFTLGEDPDCDERCMSEEDLTPCPAKNCNGVIIRELIQDIKQYVRTPEVSLSAEEIDSIIDDEK